MTPVQVDFVATESEMWTDLSWQEANPNEDDGILHDASRNPVRYRRLRQHPGDNDQLGLNTESIDVQAENVVHWFRCFRPGQMRGVSELTPSLSAFAEHRRMTFAVLSASELAASFAGVMYSDAQAFSDSPDEPEDAFDIVDIERRALLTLPAGWKMNQFQSMQPTGTYKEFKHEIINEIARCINMPLNVGLGNSAGYNYASGRLDWQVYYRMINVIRAWIGRVVCNRMFAAWLREAVGMPHYLKTETIIAVHKNEKRPEWLWAARKEIDPQKEANAAKTKLETGITTLTDEWVSEGRDPDLQMEKLKNEIQKFEENGLEHPFGKSKSGQPTEEIKPGGFEL